MLKPKNTLYQLLIISFFYIASPSIVSASDYLAGGDATKGAKAWADNCQRCHNIRGPQELRDDQWVSTMFHMRIRGGLTGQDTRDIISFLQKANTTIPPTLRNKTATKKATIHKELTGEQIYKQTCFTCHGVDGTGAFGGIPDLTDPNGRLSKSDNELLKNISNGLQSPGSPMAMPPKGGNSQLNDDDIKAVLNYMKSVFNP